MTWPWRTQSRALRLTIWFLVYYLKLSRGVLVNRTIDDQLGDSVTGAQPLYEGPPVEDWEQGSKCTGCGVQPDPSFAFQGTWHDATWHPGDSGEKVMTVSFNGSAVYVFIILANNVPFVTTLTSLSFTLDGEQVGNFVHAPTTSTDYEYNVTAYANNNLANAQHTLVMQTAGDNATLILFDYIMYSFDDEVTTSSPPSSPPPSPSSSPSGLVSSATSTTTVSVSSARVGGAPGNGKHTKTIVAASVGGLATVALIIGLFLCWYRRRRDRVSVPQIPFSNIVNDGRSLNGRPEFSYSGETTSGTWLTSSVPTGTYTTVPSHYYRSSVVPSTAIMSSSQDPSSNVAEYAHSTVEAKPSEGASSIHIPVSETHDKTAERQRDLSRRIEQMGLGAISETLPDAGPGRELVVDSRPHDDIGEAEALREQVVFLLDEVERLHAQQRLNGVDDEPPPDYSTEGRRSPLLQL